MPWGKPFRTPRPRASVSPPGELGPGLRVVIQSVGFILLIVIIAVSLVHGILSRILNTHLQPPAVNQVVSLSLDKQSLPGARVLA